MKTRSVKRSRHGVLYYQEHSGRGWSAALTLFRPWTRRELGTWPKPGNCHSLSADCNQEFPVGRFFLMRSRDARESFGSNCVYVWLISQLRRDKRGADTDGLKAEKSDRVKLVPPLLSEVSGDHFCASCHFLSGWRVVQRPLARLFLQFPFSPFFNWLAFARGEGQVS